MVLSADVWQKTPQMRVIPINKSIDPELRVMTYENAEALVRTKTNFVITPCICRKEKALKGQICQKPTETCVLLSEVTNFSENRSRQKGIP